MLFFFSNSPRLLIHVFLFNNTIKSDCWLLYKQKSSLKISFFAFFINSKSFKGNKLLPTAIKSLIWGYEIKMYVLLMLFSFGKESYVPITNEHNHISRQDLEDNTDRARR